MKRAVFKASIISICLILAIVLSYASYVLLTYERIEDMLTLVIEGTATEDTAKIGTEYTIVTQNFGFGAYTPDFSFFMDGGTESRAKSADSVMNCVNECVNTVSAFDPDFILWQEIDIDATRSYHIDQYKLFSESFSDYSRSMAINFDSAYLMYPLLDPHGASLSSIATFSRFTIDSSLRRSLPVSTTISKVVDLDRCYSVSRIKIENGRELVIYNAHTSAYGSSDEIRTAQMSMLLNDMKSEYDKGNYVICGGDFNHDLTGDSTQRLNSGLGANDFGWAQPFPEELIPDGLSRAIAYENGEYKPTCRNCDVPYSDGIFTVIVDGFIVSDNVKCIQVENVVTEFSYSDHNPVVMKFVLE